MARHPYPPTDDLSPKLKEELRKRVGPDRGNVWRMLMWSPKTAESFVDYSEAVRHGTELPPKLREFVILRVGHRCDAPYEIHAHQRIAREIGMSEAEIAAAAPGADTSGLEETERFMLAMADDLVRDKRLSETNFKKALETFGVRTTTDIILLAGFYVMACLFLNSFDIDIEQPAKA